MLNVNKFFVALTLTNYRIIKKLTVIDELKNVLPPIIDTEFNRLEESILKDGCLSPFVVWNDILIERSGKIIRFCITCQDWIFG
ncbi:MAG: hypothetical protein LBL62_03775 [Planctomycetaceae bacterium]|nr:hypothetical protein [Planctomycetaceae bacterium]